VQGRCARWLAWTRRRAGSTARPEDLRGKARALHLSCACDRSSGEDRRRLSGCGSVAAGSECNNKHNAQPVEPLISCTGEASSLTTCPHSCARRVPCSLYRPTHPITQILVPDVRGRRHHWRGGGVRGGLLEPRCAHRGGAHGRRADAGWAGPTWVRAWCHHHVQGANRVSLALLHSE
jgi:hypothetical protein